jgi:septal ring factor EnvC (AmiA/AmiB activator)
LLASGVAVGASSDTDPVHVAGDRALEAIDADRREELVARQLETLGKEKQKLLDRTTVRGRAYVHLVRLGLLPLSNGFSGFVAHANRVELLRRALARDLSRVAEIDAQVNATRDGLRQMRLEREQLVRQVADYQRSREAVLAAEERESAYQRAFSSSGDRSAHAAVYGAPAADLQARSFLDLKGRMPFPVAGRAEVHEVEATDTRGTGVQMLVEVGAVARNVFRGRVVLIGDYADLGQSVVVDHGGGYSTLYAHLHKLLVQVGDQVAAGAEIAEIEPGRDGRALLHFEVRHDGSSLLPAEWLGL